MDRRAFLAGLALPTAGAVDAFAQLPSDVGAASRHPRLAVALTHWRSRQWRELSSLVTALPAQSARALIGDLGDVAPLSGDFETLSEHPMGHTIIAGMHVGWAWRFRGRGVASTITPSGLQGFLEQLNLAKAQATQAISRDAHDGVAHAIGIAINKGLSDRVSLDAGLRGFLMAARRPVGGFSAYADAISRKWLGSEAEALGFAREVQMIDLPASAGVIADTHYVSWGARLMAGHSREQPVEDFASYLSQPATHAEILASDDAFRSVGPDPDAFANWHANCWLSFALISLNEVERARLHLVSMGGYIGGPWADLANPQQMLNSIRHRLGIEAT